MKHELNHPISKALLPIVAGMCQHPDELEVWEKDHRPGLELRFEPHMGDIRVIIGKAGRQAKALRFVGLAMGAQLGISVDVQIEESMRGDREEKRIFKFNPDFSLEDFRKVFDPMIALCLPKETGIETSIEMGNFKVLVDVDEKDVTLVTAIGDVFFVYGKSRGRKIEIKAKDKRLRPANIL